jgi:hypothetical protein
MPANKVATAKPGADGRRGVETWLKNVAPDQRALTRRIDALILGTIPGVVCGIKFRKPSNPLGAPFYGLLDQGWIAHMNALKGRVRLTLYGGDALKPAPPIAAPQGARAIDIAAEDELDEKQMKAWLQQARKAPGWGRVEPKD